MLNDDLLKGRQGVLFCLVGPTGSGKSTVGSHLLERSGETLKLSISVTSRAPRPGEHNGRDYYFVSPEDFQAKVKLDQFFEWEEVHGRCYGTLKETVDQAVAGDHDLLLDIDIRGALNFKASYPKHTVIVFMLAPSSETLIDRVRSRSALDPSEEQKRLETAREEYASLLLSQSNQDGAIDYVVINDTLADTSERVFGILNAERQRLSRLPEKELTRLCML